MWSRSPWWDHKNRMPRCYERGSASQGYSSCQLSCLESVLITWLAGGKTTRGPRDGLDGVFVHSKDLWSSLSTTIFFNPFYPMNDHTQIFSLLNAPFNDVTSWNRLFLPYTFTLVLYFMFTFFIGELCIYPIYIINDIVVNILTLLCKYISSDE